MSKYLCSHGAALSGDHTTLQRGLFGTLLTVLQGSTHSSAARQAPVQIPSQEKRRRRLRFAVKKTSTLLEIDTDARKGPYLEDSTAIGVFLHLHVSFEECTTFKAVTTRPPQADKLAGSPEKHVLTRSA